MAISEDCAARLDEIRKDRTSGAARLAVRAATMLVEYDERAPADIPDIASALIQAQPSMAPIYNLAQRVLAASDVKTACIEFLDSMERNAARVAEFAASLIEDGMTVMTHSFSSTLLAAFREAHQSGRNFTVICPESRPVCEGIALAASLGGEFALSLDGPLMPVPSWKLVVEVYDPQRLQSVFARLVAGGNQQAAKSGRTIRMAQETVDGRTYYTINSPEMGPLAAAHYTFADGYMIAAPTRALVKRALDLKVAGTSITHSEKFMALTPRDHYANFSAVLYQNLGTSLAPLAGLFSGMTGGKHGQPGQPNPMDRLGNLKPTLIAAYGAPDRITVASAGDLLGGRLEALLTGDPSGWTAGSLPLGQLFGTGDRKPAYREK